MLKIANPTYDVVFKFLLEDKKVAKLILSTIIGETIEDLDFSATERTVRVKRPEKKDENEGENGTANDEQGVERFLTVCRFDFAAKIKTDKGYKVVAIELQKAKYAEDIIRFRKYLAKHYESENNTYQDGDETKARPIYAIYLLSYDIGLPDSPVIIVNNDAIDAATGQKVSTGIEFIECLHHRSWIVQMKQLKERRRNQLEKLLDVFGIGAEKDRSHTLDIPDEDIPEEYFAVIRRLLNANADEQVRGAMELEDEVLETFRKHERKNAKKDEIIAEKDAALEANKAALNAKDAALEAQARRIAELEERLAKTQNPAK